MVVVVPAVLLRSIRSFMGQRDGTDEDKVREADGNSEEHEEQHNVHKHESMSLLSYSIFQIKGLHRASTLTGIPHIAESNEIDGI